MASYLSCKKNPTLQRPASRIRMSYQSIRVMILKNTVSVESEYIVDSIEQPVDKF